MRSITTINGKKICNECWAKLPKKETGGRAMREIGWVAFDAPYSTCDTCQQVGVGPDEPLNLLIVDPIPDANGFYTIRWDNGTENGDTEQQPVATAYNFENAQYIVDAWNSCQYKD